MSNESTTPEKSTEKKSHPHIFSYLIILFSAAFLLLAMSYFMQQRYTDQQVIDGLQQNMSAMQTTQNVIERNKELLDQNQALTDKNDELTDKVSSLEAQLWSANTQKENQEKTILALDWLWRIEREYFQGRYSSARTMIQEFEQSGLTDFLPVTPLVDEEYRAPRKQYDSIYNLLF